MLVLAPLVLLVFLSQTVESIADIKEIYSNPLAHGFGDDIHWVKWDDAVETAQERDKPIFLLIHKTWCHACKALKKTFQQSNARKAFKKLSEFFVMVNTEDDEEPYEEEYRPDGKYIPRLLFLDKDGDLLAEFKNKKAEYKNYAYYYSSPADILNSMKDLIRHYGFEVPELRKGDKLKPRGAAAKRKEEKKEGKEKDAEAIEKKEEETKEEEEEKEEEKEEKSSKKEEKKDKSEL